MRANGEQGVSDAPVSVSETAEDIGLSGTFEPLLAGDRQTENGVAKARNPLQRGVL
jgi:hypothetical protein